MKVWKAVVLNSSTTPGEKVINIHVRDEELPAAIKILETVGFEVEVRRYNR
jgi:hypothetical protein